jgi:hypothetical protein
MCKGSKMKVTDIKKPGDVDRFMAHQMELHPDIHYRQCAHPQYERNGITFANCNTHGGKELASGTRCAIIKAIIAMGLGCLVFYFTGSEVISFGTSGMVGVLMFTLGM